MAIFSSDILDNRRSVEEVEMVFVLFFLLGSVQLQVHLSCHKSLKLTFYKDNLLVFGDLVRMFGKHIVRIEPTLKIHFQDPITTTLAPAGNKQTQTFCLDTI